MAYQVRVRNITGVPQLHYHNGYSYLLPADGLSDPIPVPLAHDLQRQGTVVIADTVSIDDFLWMADGQYHVHWMSPFSIGDGYATAAENMVHALVRQGVQVHARHLWFLVEDGLLPETIQKLKEPEKGKYAVGICMATPGEFKKLPTPYRIGWTMYESTNPLEMHAEWRHECNLVDRLWVPCDWCAEVFSNFVKVPIDVAPLAINPIYCAPVLKRARNDLFKVICYATLTERKAPIETMRVFERAFPKDKYPDARLHFKTRMNFLGLGENQLPNITDPRVTVTSTNWMPEEVVAYLDSADVMMYLSRGEGFGMTPREAMARGVPTILSENTGHLPVCDSRYNWPIRTKAVEEAHLGGNWYTPDWDVAVDTLRWMYDNREKAYDKAYDGAQWFIENHGPDSAAQVAVGLMQGLDPSTAIVKKVMDLQESLALHASFIREEMSTEFDYFYEVLANEGVTGVAYVPNLDDVIRAKLAQYCPRVVPTKVYAHEISTVILVGMFEWLYDGEIQRMLQKFLHNDTRVYFAAPSVNRKIVGNENERLLRVEQWAYILKRLEVARLEYRKDLQYLYGIVTAMPVKRGTMVRQLGYVKEGVWRPGT